MPPGDNDFDIRGGAVLMSTLARLLAVMSVLVGILQVVVFDYPYPAFGGLFALAVSLAMLLCLRSGRPHVAAVIFIALLVTAAPLTAYTTGGPLSSAWLVMPLATMAAGWLFGARASYALAIYTCVVVAVVYVAHLRGVPFLPVPPLIFAVSTGLFAMMGAVVGIVSTRQYARQLRVARTLAHELAQSNSQLEARVAERTAELQRAQLDLSEQAKLASLGAIVAGVSHELNTPIGNALTMTTTLQARLDDLRKDVESGKLRRSAVDAFFRDATDILGLAEKSVRRSVEIIARFKQVAMDQSSTQRRRFDLADIVVQELAVLLPNFRGATARIDNQVASGITCDSFPGPLEQLLGNLLGNALIHAVTPGTTLTITLAARLKDGIVQLDVRDDGAGMDAPTLARVFDPFFTTRLGQGGSGMGLAISQRIATSVLGGSLHARSSPGAGSCFTLEFPCRAPGGNLGAGGTV